MGHLCVLILVRWFDGRYNAGSLQPDYVDQEAHWQRWHYPTCVQDPQEPGEVHVVYSCDFMDPEDESRAVGGIRIARLQLDQVQFTKEFQILPQDDAAEPLLHE